MFGGSLEVATLRFKFSKDRVKEIVRFQRLTISNRGDCFDPGFWSVHLSDGDCAVEGDDRGIVEFNQMVIKGKNAMPISAFIIRRGAMAGGNCGLKVIGSEFVAGRGLGNVVNAARDRCLVPG